MLALIAISSYAGASELTSVIAGSLQAREERQALSDCRRITLLGTVAWLKTPGPAASP